MNSHKISKEYAVLAIRSSDQRNLRSDALAESLFRRLRKLSGVKKTSSSISIHPEKCESEQVASWSVSIESSRSTKRVLVEEFILLPTDGPNALNYLLWFSQAPLRAKKYLSFKLSATWHRATTVKEKLLAIKNIGIQIFDVIVETLTISYIFALITFVVVRPLRKFSMMAYLVCIFAVLFAIVSLTWEQTLLPLVSGVSEFTHEVVDLAADPELTFGVLYPVLAGTIFGASVTIIIVLVQIMRWIIRKYDILAEGNFSTLSEFSYLLEPLYAAKVKDKLERHLITLNSDPKIQRICVICENVGVLLAYEVLSRACKQKISKPVYLLTRNLSLAGISASPVRSLWLLIDSDDWGRFSEPSPKRLSWHHLAKRSWNKDMLNLTSPSGNRITQVQIHSEMFGYFRRSKTAFVNYLIPLLKLDHK